MVARYFMYSSYFAIFGALFGFRNFGKLVAIDNTFNGLVGLLQVHSAHWRIGVRCLVVLAGECDAMHWWL